MTQLPRYWVQNPVEKLRLQKSVGQGLMKEPKPKEKNTHSTLKTTPTSHPP